MLRSEGCGQDIEVAKLKPSLKEVGIDLGVKDFAITSDGKKEPNPKYLRKSLKRLKMLQRRLSRKQKGSRNRDKARVRLAKLHEYIANHRENFLHQYTTWLVRNYDLICTEDLNVKGMMANHRLAQAIGDVGMGKAEGFWRKKQKKRLNRLHNHKQGYRGNHGMLSLWRIGIV